LEFWSSESNKAGRHQPFSLPEKMTAASGAVIPEFGACFISFTPLEPAPLTKMLALKKKREAEKKEREEAAKDEAAGPAAPAAGGQVSLFGIGGEKRTKKGEMQGTKKSPGEIRIQKGNFLFRWFSICLSNLSCGSH
jgi:hypothetical protein